MSDEKSSDSTGDLLKSLMDDVERSQRAQVEHYRREIEKQKQWADGFQEGYAKAWSMIHQRYKDHQRANDRTGEIDPVDQKKEP